MGARAAAFFAGSRYRLVDGHFHDEAAPGTMDFQVKALRFEVAEGFDGFHRATIHENVRRTNRGDCSTIGRARSCNGRASLKVPTNRD
jgi:hypothetical protein